MNIPLVLTLSAYGYLRRRDKGTQQCGISLNAFLIEAAFGVFGKAIHSWQRDLECFA
jgi:hypothetical protein